MCFHSFSEVISITCRDIHLVGSGAGSAIQVSLQSTNTALPQCFIFFVLFEEANIKECALPSSGLKFEDTRKSFSSPSSLSVAMS